jgi:hypothetical protein
LITDATRILEVEDSPDAVLEAFVERGWCDGLPIVPPTEERVRIMLADADRTRSLGPMPPLWREATLELLAINAVMAGCRPEYFPVIVAAVEAMLDPGFNLYGVQATTHPVAPLVIVNGPYARRIELHGGSGCFGPGFRANATIGRAVRLILMNVGGGWPGRHDMATQGSPAKFSYCFAENLVDSPWSAYHVDRGFAEGDTTVTVVAAEPPHNLHDPASTTPENLLQFIVGGMTHGGHNNLYHKGDLFLVLCPEHAALLDAAGWTRERIREEIFARAVLAPRELGREAFEHFVSRWPGQPDVDFDTHELTVAASPDDINILVAGGPGKHSSWIPTFGQSYSAIARIDYE